MLTQEQRLERALERTAARRWPDGYPERAIVIDQLYSETRLGKRSGPWGQWESAGQMAAKLAEVMNKPKRHDPTGKRRAQYQRALELFNVETGKFPDNIDPRTGEERSG